MIAADDYANTYEKIKQGYEPLEKVYASLAEINSVKDNSLYILLKQHLDVAVKAIESIAINNAIILLIIYLMLLLMSLTLYYRIRYKKDLTEQKEPNKLLSGVVIAKSV